MKKIFGNLFLGLVIAGFLSSCSLTIPVAATSNEVGGKVGSAKTTRILLFFFDGGDASIATAAKNGGIKKVSTVDFKTSVGLLGIWTTYSTTVTGE